MLVLNYENVTFYTVLCHELLCVIHVYIGNETLICSTPRSPVSMWMCLGSFSRKLIWLFHQFGGHYTLVSCHLYCCQCIHTEDLGKLALFLHAIISPEEYFFGTLESFLNSTDLFCNNFGLSLMDYIFIYFTHFLNARSSCHLHLSFFLALHFIYNYICGEHRNLYTLLPQNPMCGNVLYTYALQAPIYGLHVNKDTGHP